MQDQENQAGSEQEQENGQETEQQKKDKVSKKHEEIMKVIVAVIGNKERLAPAKTIGEDTTARIVADLFKEEDEALEAKAKEGLRDLLKKYIEYQSELRKKKKELDDLDLKKKKEFNEAANKWLGVIDRKVVMSAEYAEALKTAFTAVEEKKDC
jgi:hypothetical protein